MKRKKDKYIYDILYSKYAKSTEITMYNRMTILKKISYKFMKNNKIIEFISIDILILRV